MAFSLLGYTTGSIEVAPLGIRALVGVPATLIGLSPGAMALLYGMRARRGGLARGLVPAVIGALVVLYWILVTIAGLST
jgi:hypothetical protein